LSTSAEESKAQILQPPVESAGSRGVLYYAEREALSMTQQQDEAVKKAIETTKVFYQKVIDLEHFDREFVLGVTTTLLGLKEEEKCFLVPYNRAILDIRSIIALNRADHFQAVAMLARSIFEHAAEIKLIATKPDAWIRMIAFERLEKLKAAEKAIEFAAGHNLQFPHDLKPYEDFIKNNGLSIESVAKTLFGTTKLTHWSQMNVADRAKQLGAPFEEIYESLYKILSWNVHGGLAGVNNMSAESFPYLFGIACQIAAESFEQILGSVITKFQISSAIEHIHKEMKFASMRAGATGDERLEAQLRKEIMR